MSFELRDDVLILASTRATAGLEDLTASLEKRRIHVDRIYPGPDSVRVLADRRPRVLVLDYLLDELGTAVDILEQQVLAPDTKILLWTDEPSVSVAVTLMKLGVDEYLLSNRPKAVDHALVRISQWIEEHLESQPIRERKGKFHASSPSMRVAYAIASQLASQTAGVACVSGAKGTGRSTYAKEVHALQMRSSKGATPRGFISIDWDIESPTDVAALLRQSIPADSTVCIDHFDCDTGESVDAIASMLPWLEQNRILLLLGIRSTTLLPLIQTRIPQVVLCELSPLGERSEDILPIVDEVLNHSQKKVVAIAAEDLETITSLPWPGNLTQFIACIRELPFLLEQFSKDKLSVATLLTSAHDRWVRLARSPAANGPSLLATYRAFCKSGGDIRYTAAALNSDVRTVTRLLVASGIHRNHQVITYD